MPLPPAAVDGMLARFGAAKDAVVAAYDPEKTGNGRGRGRAHERRGDGGARAAPGAARRHRRPATFATASPTWPPRSAGRRGRAARHRDPVRVRDRAREVRRGDDAEDEATAAAANAYWVAFARTGDPNGEGRPKWPAYSAKDDMILDFASAARREGRPVEGAAGPHRAVRLGAAGARAGAARGRHRTTPWSRPRSPRTARSRSASRLQGERGRLRGDWMEGPRDRAPGEGRPGRLVGERGPPGPGLLQLLLRRRRREDGRSEERHDQAGHRQRRQHGHGPRPRGRVPGREAGPARRDPDGLVPVEHARWRAAAARLHAARLRREPRPLPGPLPAARGRRRGLGLEHDRAGRLHPGQPARGEEGAADADRDAERQPAAPGEPAPARARHDA